MKLERLDIQQLAGIQPGFVLDNLDAGLNLVIGPNASGKSSIARALYYLLKAPDRSDPVALSLVADLRRDVDLLTVRRTGSNTVWLREGTQIETPPLPDSRFFRCWWLTVEDLLQVVPDGEAEGDAGRDREIAEWLHRELTGGYDLETVLGERGPFYVGPRHGINESGEYSRRLAAVHDVERGYEALQHERERVPELEASIEQGSKLPALVGRLERALELLAAQRDRRTLEAGLETFPAEPAEMERLRGDERSRLESLESQRCELEKEDHTWRAKRREAEEALSGTGLADEVPDLEAIEEHQRLLSSAQTKLATRQAAIERRDAAQAEEETASSG